jgi:hypothetical protein
VASALANSTALDDETANRAVICTGGTVRSLRRLRSIFRYETYHAQSDRDDDDERCGDHLVRIEFAGSHPEIRDEAMQILRGLIDPFGKGGCGGSQPALFAP